MGDSLLPDRGYRGPGVAMSVDEMVFSGETLESLLEASKTPVGRWRLSSAGTLDAILQLPSFPPYTLLLYLRLLRNLCAGEAANQNSFVKAGGPDRIAAVLLGPPPTPPEVLRVGLQLLGNVALAGEAHRSVVWARFFASGFLELARVRDPVVCDPLCMVLDTCCSSDGGRRRLEELCGIDRGLPILLEIITTASTGVSVSSFHLSFFRVCTTGSPECGLLHIRPPFYLSA